MTTLEATSFLANIVQIVAGVTAVATATNIKWKWYRRLGKYSTPLFLGLLFLIATIVKRVVPSDSFTFDPPKIIVAGKQFYNTEVVLDDHIYTNCYMQNVTLRFMGKRPFYLTGNTMAGFVFNFDKPEMKIVATMLSEAGFIKTNIGLIRDPRP
jgi:hypothetical protein